MRGFFSSKLKKAATAIYKKTRKGECKMIHIRKQIIHSSIGISLLCSVSTNFCMEKKSPKITFSEKCVSIGLELFFGAKKTATDFGNMFEEDLRSRTTGNKKLVGQNQDLDRSIKEIAEKINDIKYPPQYQAKLTIVIKSLELIEQCKTQFNMNEHTIGQKIYDMQPLIFDINNKKASVILDIIRHSREHTLKIEAMHKTREEYLVGEINNFYAPQGNYVMREVDDIVEYNADALYKANK